MLSFVLGVIVCPRRIHNFDPEFLTLHHVNVLSSKADSKNSQDSLGKLLDSLSLLRNIDKTFKAPKDNDQKALVRVQWLIVLLHRSLARRKLSEGRL